MHLVVAGCDNASTITSPVIREWRRLSVPPIYSLLESSLLYYDHVNQHSASLKALVEQLQAIAYHNFLRGLAAATIQPLFRTSKGK